MSAISRRSMITRGLAAAAGLSGLAVAERIADRYGLVPPDHGGVYGPGETMTYAAQRLITRQSLALVAFLLVHVAMIWLAGFGPRVRAMLTGAPASTRSPE